MNFRVIWSPSAKDEFAAVIYRLKEDTIEILHVWDNRQNPEKFEG
jgi:hypothetical protein